MTKHIPLWDYQQDESEDTIYISYMGTNVAQTEKPKIAIRLVRYANSHEALVNLAVMVQKHLDSEAHNRLLSYKEHQILSIALKLAVEED